MINFDIENPTRNSCLIDADKKNIRNESAIVILLGSFYLVFFSRIMHTNYLWSYIPFSLLYILTGISGCMCLRSNSSGFQTLYKALIILSIVIKIMYLGFLIFLVVVLILNPVDCSKSKSDTCSLGAGIWLLVLLLSIVGLIIISATLSLFYVMLKHLNKYQNDIRSVGFIYFT